MREKLKVRQLGIRDYPAVYEAMQRFTQSRHQGTRDEVWCLQHRPVYTLGLNGREEHLLRRSQIPIVKSDRGGQVTFHGPGQLIIYPLIDLHRKSITIREYVRILEQSIIDFCRQHSVVAERRAGAPGVYVNGKKIAALGIRIKKGCSYHGLALNVRMDLAPFLDINPCGYAGLEVTQLYNEGCRLSFEKTCEGLILILSRYLNYSDITLLREEAMTEAVA